MPVSEVAVEALPAETALLLLRVQLLLLFPHLVATFPVEAALHSPILLAPVAATTLPLRVLIEVVLPAQKAATAEDEEDEEA